MFAKHLTLLLCIVYSVQSDTRTTQLPEYPCNQQILFGFQISLTVDSFIFQRQMSFLENHVFEQWTHFDQLAFLSYSDFEFKKFGSFSSKSDVHKYLQGFMQININCDLCEAFSDMSTQGVTNTKIILFAIKFQSSDIRDECILSLRKLTSAGNEFAFIPLSNQFNGTVLNKYFKQAKIIEWDLIKAETPNDWEQQFNDFYGCSNSKSITIGHSTGTTTENPNIQFPSCNPDQFVVAFDKSTGFSSQEYQQIKTLLIDHVFKNWTRFGQQLAFYSFAHHVYSTAVPLENKDDLIDFIQSEEQIYVDPNFCNLFYNVFYSRYAHLKNHGVVFLSKLNKEELERINTETGNTCKQDLFTKLNSRLTFVILNNAVDIDYLREYTPQSQFIRLNLFDVQTNLEWQFNTAFGCNQDNYDDKSMYPGNSKFIFGYEVSSDLIAGQRNFLINGVFNNEWNVFNNLALIAYSNDTQIQNFGTIASIEDVHEFIDNSTQQNVSSISLCSVFKKLTTMYIQEVNMILFVSNFHTQVDDECSIWIKEVRENVNTITFVSLTRQVSTEYLALKFPQAVFTSWNPSKSMPDNWNIEFYGCQNFVVSGKYPCFVDFENVIIYDRSRFLSPFAYQRLTYFLLKRVFIKQWLNFYRISIYNYPDNSATITEDLMSIELFIRQSLQSNKEPLICPIFNDIKDADSSNLIFFISKFDESVLILDDACKKNIQDANKKHIITFFKLTHLVNKTLLHITFPNATINDWDIEKYKEPAHWNQLLWNAFGCHDDSPIILPHTSTIAPKPHTSTKTTPLLSSTVFSSTTQTTIIKSSITTTTSYLVRSTPRTTTHSSKPPIALIVVPSVLGLIILLIVIAGALCFFRYRQKDREKFIANLAFSALVKIGQEHNRRRSEIDLWRLNPEDVELFSNRKLGSGAFANVFLGRLSGDAGIKKVYPDIIALRGFCDCEVAVKSLPFYATELNKDDFKQEINFMKKLKYHPHIVCFLGYTDEHIVLEYCKNGDLMTLLKKNKEQFNKEEGLKLKDLIGFAWQIGSGMEYFASLELVHRDLAARNVLLTANLICKVSDFGLSREGNLQSYTSKRRLPVRWLPPESLKSSEYSTKTDVWSYAVLLYEVFSLANLPYSGLYNEEILSYIEDGNRLEQPEHATEEVYNLMLTCWDKEPNNRPTFTQICQKLIPLLEEFDISYNYLNPVEVVTDAGGITENRLLRIFDRIEEGESVI